MQFAAIQKKIGQFSSRPTTLSTEFKLDFIHKQTCNTQCSTLTAINDMNIFISYSLFSLYDETNT